ncbi:MAG: response regulator [Anaerolineae bacterium]|jgi:hypothetical protein
MTPARILIVEDDNIIALELEDRLRLLGYTVAGIVASGEAAIARAQETQSDLVLMDIRLRGGMDGVEAAGEIRRRWGIPVIYVTAYADDQTLQRAKRTEPYGYIIKPFEERELHTTIEMALYKHQMEARLRESEEWLSTTLRSIGDAVIATDGQQRVSFLNPVAETLTGWTQPEALGQAVSQVFVVSCSAEQGARQSRLDSKRGRGHPEPVARAAEDSEGASASALGQLRRGARSGQEDSAGNQLRSDGIDQEMVAGWLDRVLDDGSVVHADNCTLEALDGGGVPVDLTIAPIQTEGEPVRGAVLVFRDVTERQRQAEEKEHLQAQLLQAQKMEALGILAGGIAHDFNNLMTTVIGYSSLALADLDEQDALYRRLAAIQWAGERAAALTQQILALSKRDPARPQVLQLNAVLGRLEEVLRRVLGPDIELVLVLEPDLAAIEIDPVHIERVLVSLVTNAYEAIAGPGTVMIQTRNVRAGDERPAYVPPQDGDGYVCLSVADTGVGLDEDTRRHIFEPFFSTKDKGAGLGLSVVYGLVHQRGGWIDVTSQAGQGATFQVYLPAVFDTLGAPPMADGSPTHVPGSGQRILLVEDEAHVRAPIAEMLRSDGYEVTAVGSVEQARAVFDREQGAFDLVFSDVSLPDGDGLQLVADLLTAQPNLKVLLSSGHIDRAAQWPIIRERGYRFLAKPYGLQELLPAVYQAISGA